MINHLLLFFIGTFIISGIYVTQSKCENNANQVIFVEATTEAGLNFKHFDGRSGRRYFVETLGSSAAFFDYDNDGDVDIYLVNGADLPGITSEVPAENVLYRNNGDGTFTDVTAIAGVADTGYGVGCAAGDYDNDGYLDLYVTNYEANVLYHNNGDGTFTDVTAESGVGETRWSAGCAFADYDNDGYLDLFVANYLQFDFDKERVCKHRNIISYCDPRDYVGIPDTLYHNNGDGTFTDVTREAGVYNPIGHGLGVVFGDYNNDGYIDLYVANDTTQNFLYHNNGDGTFIDVSLFAGVGFSENGRTESSMGTDFGDYDNDGYLDIIVTNFQDEVNTLYHNDGNGFFSDVSFASGIGAASLKYMGWGAHFFDYDNDGDEDIIAANGHLFDNVEMFDDVATYPQINHLYRNDGKGKFTEVSAQSGSGFSPVKVSRGAVLGDYDNDGDIDILITNSNQTVDLLRNEGGNRNHWLMIKTIGTKSNRDGIGARITVTVGNQSFIDEVRSGSGYIGQDDMRVMFGLGKNKKVDTIHIRWPSGIEDVIRDVEANQLLIVTEGQPKKIRYVNLGAK